MATTRFVEQSVDQLGLALYGEAVDPSQYVIFAENSVAGNGGRLSLIVIGASHLATIQMPGGLAVSEMLTCYREESARPLLLAPSLLPTNSSYEYRDDNFEYTFEFEIFPLTGSCERQVSEIEDRCSLTAHASFPSQDGRKSSVTVVGAQSEGLSVRIHSLHFYESESMVALSRSTLTLT